jgi:hypothetical protein
LGLSGYVRYSGLAALLVALAATGFLLRSGESRQRLPGVPVAARADSPPDPALAAALTDAGAPAGRARELTRSEGTPVWRPSSPPAPTLDPGAYQPPKVIIDAWPRVYALTRNVWVRPEASSAQSWIGFLWFGSSVRLREPQPHPGPGCAGSWYAVEPRGYVCVDGERATLDAQHPAVQRLTQYSPQLASAWPHRYGESLDLERYVVLPSAHTQRAREQDYGTHQALLQRARAGEAIGALLGVDLSRAAGEELSLSPLPRTLQMDRDRLRARSTVAWTREQLHAGRSFLLSSDLKWVPKDRVKAYPTSTFHGVHLGRGSQLPLAFFRARDRPSYRRGGSAAFEPAEHVFTRLSWVELTGRSEGRGAEAYLETRQAGLWVKESDAVVPAVAAATPWGTALDGTQDAAAPLRGQATWIEVSVLGGWLLAYRGSTPVFATLVSAGRGGVPEQGRDPLETAATPLGRFRITGKFATATMVAPNDLVHSEVPWAQNFSGPHALHAAYWHDRWGELQSGGCLNVSPLDGRWLFREFTQPSIPEGWHGVRWLPSLEASTLLIIRR